MQTLDDKAFEEKSFYPLWPLTLITTNKSKPQLQEKLLASSEQLHFPVKVMTLEEAPQVRGLKDNDNMEAWIVPLHWKKGIENEDFQQWKNEIKERAKKAAIARDTKEQEIKKWEMGLIAFEQFINTHPFEKIKQLSETRSGLYLRIDELSRRIKKRGRKDRVHRFP